MTQTVADERLVGIEPSGACVQVIAAIGLPYQVSPEEWACPVSLAGLHKRRSFAPPEAVRTPELPLATISITRPGEPEICL
jgi:hypothetical protein